MFSPTNIVTYFYILYATNSVEAAGRTVSDWRIQDHDITPVLGRGYSVATGSLQSSCLTVNHRTKPSYDFDYFLTEIESDTDVTWSSKFKNTYSYSWVKDTVDSDRKKYQAKTRSEMYTHYIIATMRTERYYSSVDENKAELSDDARNLLESGQFISFFQACGPNYIRSINRAAEITAIFSYESSEKSGNSQFESELKKDLKGYYNEKSSGKYKRKIDYNQQRNSLTISIKAHGLGLNEDGAVSMIASSMDDFEDVMNFAFKSMQTEGIGMVQGVEIVPWVDNPQFQVAAGLADTLQVCDDDEDEKKGDNEKEKCSTFPIEMKKMTLSSNAEFIATLNRVMMAAIDNLYNLQNCQSLLYDFSEADANKLLVNHKTDDASSITVNELKQKVDKKALSNAQEYVQKYTKYFYGPCMQALSNDYAGQKGGTVMVKNWFSTEQCQDITCTAMGAIIGEDGKCSMSEGEDVSRLTIEQYCMPRLY